MYTAPSIQSFKVTLNPPSIEMGMFGDLSIKNDQVIIPFCDVFYGVLGIIYLMCDLVTGAFAWSLGIVLSLAVKEVARRDTSENLVDSFWFFTYLQLFGWITQFVGHGIYERKYTYFL